MIEFLLGYTLFGYTWLFYVFFVIYVITLLICENNGDGKEMVFYSLLFWGVILWKGNIDFVQTFSMINIILYLIIGLTYSFIRTFLFARKQQKLYLLDVKKYTLKAQEEYDGRYGEHEITKAEYVSKKLEGYKGMIHKKVEIKDHFFSWWFAWPVSSIYWVCGDLMSELFNSLWFFMKNLINSFVKFAEKTVNID